MNFKFALPALALAAAAGFTAPANAVVPVYSPIKTPNTASYSFTAASDGEVGFYWLGGITVSYGAQFSYSVNGSAFTPVMYNFTTAPGAYFDLGDFTAGDEFVFKLTLTKPAVVAGNEIFSDPALNGGGLQEVYSASYGGGDFGVPLGDYTYLAFEDIMGYHDGNRKSDFDYNDDQYAFVNLSSGVVPEPATWAMLIAGFGMVGFSLRRRKTTLSVVSA
ncbi:PEPxxWA-CTERM sorting domain-containing protein [Sandaracinobacteroides hominis]|uniref:PEPxxWA-CTERM sorting domain-containing protein n=1 Tax=Sandaracinobacteroides hominis TaxID=2780086 RepID=UPI001F382355|nr:PEPxxWA-CTERM sorting domain-containing protein [Sandaracinobacteroides hominis]